MLTGWRIVREKHAHAAFNGEGARVYGGRWNSKGFPVVYCSESRSLAALETLVHLNPQIPARYVIFRVQFEPALLVRLSIEQLPVGWDAEPPGQASMSVGDRWLLRGESAVLGVPSCLTGETNFLLNPQHKDFDQIRIGASEVFTFDSRLL